MGAAGFIQEIQYGAKLNIFSYSINQLMEVLHVSRQTVYDEINSGRLKTFKIGRRRFVSDDALREYIKDREEEML